MADMIQIELSNQSCSAGLEYARRQSGGLAKDAILCCEGMCLKGETARRAANLMGHRLVPEKTVRICHGGLLEKRGGMRDLVVEVDPAYFGVREDVPSQVRFIRFNEFEARDRRTFSFQYPTILVPTRHFSSSFAG